MTADANARAADEPVLRVRDLTVSSDAVELVRGVSFTVAAGERVGIIGESGSGKSLTALATLGLLDDELHARGSVRLGGVPFELVGASDRQLSSVRGKDAGMVFQEPLTALNPSSRLGNQIVEGMRLHRTRSTRAAAHTAAEELLGRLLLPEPARAARAYPHQLSGGQRQRGLLGIALANDPGLLICDEPTTALDVTVQKQIVDLIVDVSEEQGSGVLFISHDLALVASVCSRVLVMYGGRIVESGPVDQVLNDPRHPYTRALRAASDLTPGVRARAIPGTVPAPGDLPPGCPFASRCPHADDACVEQPPLAEVATGHAAACWHHQRVAEAEDQAGSRSEYAASGEPDAVADPPELPGERPLVLSATGLTRRYRTRRTRPFAPRGELTALEDVSLELRAGDRVGVVGESGAGKSTLLRLLAGLDRPTEGTVGTRPYAPGTTSTPKMTSAHGAGVQMVFQDPMGSLDPRMRVRDIIAEPLRGRGGPGRPELNSRVAELLDSVGLPRDAAGRYPHQFSGGQRQRVAIARALAPEPAVLLADEPVSALDVSVRAQVLDLLRAATAERGTALCLISHDLGVVRYLCDTVVVLRGGVVVERGPVEEVWKAPRDAYTEELLRAVPRLDSAAT